MYFIIKKIGQDEWSLTIIDGKDRKTTEVYEWNYYEQSSRQHIHLWKKDDPQKRTLYLVPVANTLIDLNDK